MIPTYPLGTIVRSKFDAGTDPVKGYVTGIEWYMDFGGSSEYVYVRWVPRSGPVDDKSTRFSVAEIEAA